MTFSVVFDNPYPACTVKELLEEHLLIPRKIRHFLRTKKTILINGQFVHWQTVVEKGATITLLFDEEDYPEKEIIKGDASLVECIYEDEHLIVVNKVEGMKTHGNLTTEVALLNHVSSYTKTTCYVIHRLDKETSGLVIFAKNPFILPLMNRLLESKQIKREYHAVVEGDFKKQCMYTEGIGRHRHDRRKRVVDLKKGKSAITHVKPISSQLKKATLVACQLETGRTHQIRVHLSWHGYPIIGDPLYHPKPVGRLMLHAANLSFYHPLTGKEINLSAKSKSFDAQIKKYK